jgi:hypothetical protein
MLTTIEFYKGQIQEIKHEFDEELFKDRRLFDTQVIDKEEWKVFKTQKREKHGVVYQNDTGPIKPSFEDSMAIDIIRAMRRDRMTTLKNKSLSQGKNN